MVKALTAALAMALATFSQQGATGEITGKIGLPDVRVVIQADGETTSTTVTTGADGRFSAPKLAPGTYFVSFYLKGYRYLTRSGVSVGASSRAQVDVTLEKEPPDAYGGKEPMTLAMDKLFAMVLPGEVPLRLETEFGDFYFVVDQKRAPITAANFLKYVDAHLYDAGTFHRATRPENYNTILPNRPMMNLIQGGINPARRAEGFPPIPLERTSVTGLKHVAGTVSMARGTPDSATSDFFILLDDQPSLDFGGKRFDDAQGAAAFGHMLWQTRVVRDIQQRPVTGQNLTPPVEIRSIRRLSTPPSRSRF